MPQVYHRLFFEDFGHCAAAGQPIATLDRAKVRVAVPGCSDANVVGLRGILSLAGRPNRSERAEGVKPFLHRLRRPFAATHSLLRERVARKISFSGDSTPDSRLPGRDAVHSGFLDDREEGLLGAAPGLQQGRKVALARHLLLHS